MSLIDITGQKFGKLTVIEKLPSRPGVKASIWRCRCDCGKETIAQGTSLRQGYKKSCGCLMKKAYRESRNCEYCGMPVHSEYLRFCSRSCASKARSGVPYVEVDTSIDWEKVNGKYKCPYQRFVSCTNRDCDHCGWNPEVAKARTKAFMEQRKVEAV
jgi:hypothetical protein